MSTLVKINARRKDICQGCTNPIKAGDSIYYSSNPKTILCKTCGERKVQSDAANTPAAVAPSPAPAPTKALNIVMPKRGFNIPGVKRTVSKPKPMASGRAISEDCYCAAINRKCGACEEKSLGGGRLRHK